jgi:hypothetical protein
MFYKTSGSILLFNMCFDWGLCLAASTYNWSLEEIPPFHHSASQQQQQRNRPIFRSLQDTVFIIQTHGNDAVLLDYDPYCIVGPSRKQSHVFQQSNDNLSHLPTTTTTTTNKQTNTGQIGANVVASLPHRELGLTRQLSHFGKLHRKDRISDGFEGAKHLAARSSIIPCNPAGL